MLVSVSFGLTGGVATLGDEPIDDDERMPWLSLDHLDTSFELEADYRYNRVDSNPRSPFRGRRSQSNREWGFEEIFGLSLGGQIIDPSVMTFEGDLRFGLTQDHYTEFSSDFGTRRDTDRGHLLQYDLRANFFPGQKISGSVYGIRQDDRIDRRFQPTLEERRTGFGTSWVFADDTFPMELTYDFLRSDRQGNRNGEDDEQFAESTLHYSARWLIDDHHKFDFAFEHAETEQEYQGRTDQFETTRDLFTLEHVLEFGDDYRNSLRTLVHWQEESGDFARDYFEIGPQLTIHHSDNLQSFYMYQFNRERYSGLDIETHRLDYQLVHQLYTNLTTTLDLFGLYEDVENDINTTQWGGSVDWQYQRRNPYGQLYADLALAYDTEQVRGDNGRRIVLNEAHTLRDPLSVILRNRNVRPLSIVVTDGANQRVFQIGRDYLVFRSGSATGLMRLPSGRIADNTTILVDYQYDTPSDGDLDTIRVDFHLEQRFKNGLTPYYRFSYRNQEDNVSTGFTRRADRTDHHRIGVTYEQARYTLGSEFEVFDDTIEPYHAFHLTGFVHVLQQPDHTLDGSVRFSRFHFEGGVDRHAVSVLDLELDYHRQLTETLSAMGRLGYRIEEHSVEGTTQGWDATVGVEFAVGALLGEIAVEYDRLDLPGSGDEDFGVYCRLRREFGNVLASR